KSRTTARASPPIDCPPSSIPSSPRRRSGRGPDSASRWRTGSRRSTEGGSTRAAKSAGAAASASCCRDETIVRVLIVDDDAAMGEYLRDRLGRRGIDALVEAEPEEALERIAVNPFDAVVTDVRMRGISGIELCERVTASHPHVPVLVITAFGSVD